MNERQADYVRQLLSAFFGRDHFLALFRELDLELYSDEELDISDEASRTKAHLARKLVAQLFEAGRMEELVAAARRVRPVVDWDVLDTIQPEEPRPARDKPPRPPSPLPAGSRMPYRRNPHFVGREDTLMTLSRPFVDTKVRVPLVQSVQGASGSGTTQFAVELAYRFGYFFKSVHWIDGSRPGAIGAEIAACGAAMGLSDWPQDLPAQIERTLREWQHPNLHLLILDNIDDVAAAQVWLDQLAIGSLRLLITTVRDDWPADVRLGGLAPEDSHALLRFYVPEPQASDADLDRLAERLRHMPLALDLAGRYLAQQPQLTVSGYLRKLARARKTMDGFSPVSTESVAALGVSLDLVDPAARRMFLAAGYCAPDQPVPAEILRRVAGLDEAECDRLVTVLTDLGLLAPAAPGIGPIIHSLAARFARSVAKVDAGRGQQASAAPSDAGARASSILAGLADVLGVLTYQVTENDPEVSHLFRPHLEAAALAADGAGLAQAGTLWNNLGYYRKTAGDLVGAREVFERALALNVALYSRDHPNVARDLNNLGLVLHDQGDLSGARTLIERALEIDRAAPGESDLTVAADLSNLAGVLQDQGEVEAAREAFEEALALFQARLPASHPYVEIARDNLKALAS